MASRKWAQSAPVLGGALLILAIGILLGRAIFAPIDLTDRVTMLVEPVLAKAGVTDRDLTRQALEMKLSGGREYLSLTREYLSSGVDLKGVGSALNTSLKKSAYRLTRSELFSSRSYEQLTCVIRYKTFDVATMLIKQKRRAPAEKAAAPVRRFEHPKVAIVLDDFGYTLGNLDVLFGIRVPVTFSILPNLRHTALVARRASAEGDEVILHLPLEPKRTGVDEEVDAINSRLSKREVLTRLNRDIKSVPGIVGVSNHMGSKSTEEPELMRTIFDELKARGLFFLDSYVTNKSVCRQVASDAGIRFAQRTVFLDNSLEDSRIRAQLEILAEKAFKNGVAIGIGHDRKETARVLALELPRLEEEGIVFVKVSDLAT